MIRWGLSALVLLFACAPSANLESPSTLAPPAPVTATGKRKASAVYEIIVDQVFPNSPAERGGLKSGDKILKVDDEPIFTHKGFLDALAGVSNGEESTFTILRDGSIEEIDFIPGRGRFRFGFRFKTRDPEITKQIITKIWPDEVDPKYKKFTIFFHAASLMSRSSRSPQRKILQRLKELLLNKGYIFTEDAEGADFIVETEYKYPKDDATSTRIRKKRKVSFDAFRVLFKDRKSNKAFLKVSGTIDHEKSKVYGAKGYVFAMLDVMIEKFPEHPDRKKSRENYAVSEKKLINDKSSSNKNRFPAASPF